MTLIKSISGIRGTIGGMIGNNLTPPDIVKFTTGYARWLSEVCDDAKTPLKVVIGRDARTSGEMVSMLVEGALRGYGIDVVDVGLCTTPGVEMAVTAYMAHGGIILTASHNGEEWNALKLLDRHGEFLSAEDGETVLKYAESDDSNYSHQIGETLRAGAFHQQHIDAVLALPLVDVKAVRAKKYKVVVDGINSVGGVVIPMLLEQMGVEAICLNCDPNGRFAHNPEPVPENMTGIAQEVVSTKANLGIVVDPDVDRLAIVCEDGTMFGEEYTLVAVADYVLSRTPGNTVSNLSSTRALRDVTERHGGKYSAAAVGEVNVVAEMKRVGAVIGGEGNGGVIYPALHYGRDALVGVALFLTHLANRGGTASQMRDSYPQYHMLKEKLTLSAPETPEKLLERFAAAHEGDKVDRRDGVKVDFPHGWVHLRKSNTEPIVRIYVEGTTREEATRLLAATRREIGK